VTIAHDAFERRATRNSLFATRTSEVIIVSSIDPNSALVLFSGGQDSTVCLAWALERFARVETVGFDYDQRQSRRARGTPARA